MKYYKLLLLFTVITVAGNVGATIKTVKSGDNLYSVLRKSVATDTIMIEGGEYTVDKTITLANDLVIIGVPGSKPVINLGVVTVGPKTKNIVFDNLKIVLDRKYFLQITGEKDIDIENITIRNCVVDLNAVGATLLTNNATGAKNRIGNYIIQNSIVYNITVPSHGILNFSTENEPQIDRMSLTNSTFSNFSRGLMFCKKLVGKLAVDVSNCTFYNINTSNNNSGVFRCSLGEVDINISKSIFHFAGDATKFIVISKESKAVVTDSYRTSEIATLTNSRGLKNAGVTAAALFESPNDNPTATDCSFAPKDTNLSDMGIGDPRWIKK
ncbi:DUF5123 domain-containing protein [Dysgonomonas sp. 511]|uniref:DUF5123 domain-containing protein n=1 Tax=Dysgonomonas sp. 511 TaxID=2302930 RepID=UPI0013D2D8A8|nr:DUF5123 domain-containing protein [Dysgonomonas sp. 511]NDV78197.1 DUF4957 domain-containing protein [Dysgonomonas sp. 511]